MMTHSPPTKKAAKTQQGVGEYGRVGDFLLLVQVPILGSGWVQGQKTGQHFVCPCQAILQQFQESAKSRAGSQRQGPTPEIPTDRKRARSPSPRRSRSPKRDVRRRSRSPCDRREPGAHRDRGYSRYLGRATSQDGRRSHSPRGRRESGPHREHGYSGSLGRARARAQSRAVTFFTHVTGRPTNVATGDIYHIPPPNHLYLRRLRNSE